MKDVECKHCASNVAKMIIVGNKPLHSYIPAVVFAFESYDVVALSAVGSNINKLERLVKLLSVFKDVQEVERKQEAHNVGKQDSKEKVVLMATMVFLKRGVL